MPMLPTSVPRPIWAPFGAIDCCHFQGSHWLFSFAAPYWFRSTKYWGSRLELSDEADLDRDDVVGAGTRREVLGEVRVVRCVVLDVFLDRDAGVGLLELLVEIVVAEVAEQVDAERHVAMARRGRGAREERSRCHQPRRRGSPRPLFRGRREVLLVLTEPSLLPSRFREFAPSPRAFGDSVRALSQLRGALRIRDDFVKSP